MVVYRVISEKDILLGKTGSIVLTQMLALSLAREKADDECTPYTVFRYDKSSKGLEFVTQIQPRRSATQKRILDEAQRRQKEHTEYMAKLRREHDAFVERMRADALRQQEYYRQQSGRAYQSSSQRPNAAPVKTKMTVAMSNLNLSGEFDQATLKSNYRKQAMKHHPDKGGDVKNFQYVQRSYEYILEVKGWK